MRDERKTKKELIKELARLRRQVSKLERSELERKRAENTLLENEKRFRDIRENAMEWVWEVDASGKYTYSSPVVERLLGYKPEELLEKHFYDLFAPEERDDLKKAAFEIFAEKLPFKEFIHPNIHKNGKVVYLSTSGVPVLDERGNLLGYRGSDTDITERKQADDKLKKTLEDLEMSNRELEQFAYVASHDLQEPLRMVSSYTQLLAKRYKGKLDADAHEFINYAVDGANTMQKLISDLLILSRVGTRGKPLKKTNCKKALAQAVANLQASIKEAHADITYDSLPTVMADGSQLVQLFQNLIGNAIKFRSESAPHIHVSAEKNGIEWVFSVSDNGIGIDQRQADRIFAIFQRLHAKGRYPGTGIGLAMCKKIVERHEGRIWVKSEPGKGSIFYFTIPG